MTIAQCYNEDTKVCIDDQRKTVINLSTDMLGFVFGIPSRDEVFLTTEVEAMRVWDKDTTSFKRHMNEN